MRRMFSEKQIKKLCSDLLASGQLDIVAKTLQQAQPSWECDISSLFNPNLVAEGSTLYAKFVQYGNTILFIVSGNFINGTASDANPILIDDKIIDIPDEIASKIFRADGSKLNENTSGTVKDTYICGDSFVRNTNNVASGQVLIVSPSSKKISVLLYNMGTHAEGDKCFIDMRIPILIA